MTQSYRVKFDFSSTFPHVFGPTSPTFPLSSLLSPSVVIFLSCSLFQNPVSDVCSALDCQTGVCCSYMNYGNKEIFKFFKIEAIKQMGITALRTESNSQRRGLNNRM